jgi:lysophospholipase L1-like esterase
MLAALGAGMILPGEKFETKPAPAYSAEASSFKIEHTLWRNPTAASRRSESLPAPHLPSQEPSAEPQNVLPADEAAQEAASDEVLPSPLPEAAPALSDPEPSAEPSALPGAEMQPDASFVPVVSEISALPEQELSELPYAEPGVAPALPPQETAELPEGSFTGFESGNGSALQFAWGDAVPASAAVTDDWFADAAFVGNSLTDGLKLYGHLASGSFYSAQSISVFDVGIKQVYELSDGSKTTLLDALSRKQFKKVYIMLGVNELWTTPSTFHENFASVLDTIAAAEPNASIYIQSILPVSKSKSTSGSSITREKVLAFNAELKAIALEKSAFYVDTFAAFADAEGYLPSASTFDGVHLNASDYSTWHSYLLTHSIAKAQPKPAAPEAEDAAGLLPAADDAAVTDTANEA